MNRTVLYASEGKVLTNGDIFGKVVYLAESETADGYTEITEEEFLQIFEGGTTLGQATEEDYVAALKELGVNL